MTSSLTDMKRLYTKAKQAYYNTDPIMSDSSFDKLEDKIRKVDPLWKELKQTGVKVENKKTEVALAHPMPSLNKVYPEATEKWLAKTLCPDDIWVVMDKLDGSSLQVTYDKGLPLKVVTRGDGLLGGDISFLIPHLNLPRIEDKSKFVLRCEALMKKQIFEKKWASEFDNGRNMVNGLLNRKTPHPALSDVDIIVLGCYKGLLSSGLAGPWGSVVHKIFRNRPTTKALETLLTSRLKNSEYEMDGLVIAPFNFVLDYKTNDKPKNIVAFKVNNEADEVEAVVEKIIWQVSGRSRIVPKIKIKPARIGGVTVTHAAAHNAAWMTERKIGPGAVVKIVRSGGVIPKIVSVVKAGKASVPDIPHKLDGKHFVVSKASNETIRKIAVENTVKFMKTMGIEFLAEKTINKAFIYMVDPEDYIVEWANNNLDFIFSEDLGMGKVIAKKINAEFDRVFSRKVSMLKMMVASQCFGVGIGERKLLQIQDAGVSMEWLTREDHEDGVVEEVLLAVNGFSDKTVRLVIEGMRRWWDFVGRVEDYVDMDGSLPKKTKAPTKGKLVGEVVSWTGYRSKEEEAAVPEAGGEVSKLCAKTTVLLYNPDGKFLEKVEAAKARGIRVCQFVDLKI